MVMSAVMVGHADPVSIIDMDDDSIRAIGREHQTALKRDRHILSCPECHGPVHPLHCTSGLWVFRHNPGAGHTCSIKESESEGHVFLKTLFCRAARAVPGWLATVEQPLDKADPETGRPAVVDVFATKADGKEKPYGFEIQLSAMTESAAENRHELRAGMQSCSWVTTVRPSWAGLIPWSQVTKGDDDKTCIVVDGVNYWGARPDGTGDDWVQADPFPVKNMVRSQLRHRMLWTKTTGWTWPGWNQEPQQPPRRASGTATGRAQQYCTRAEAAPTWTAGWSDDDWQLQAHVSHSRLRVRSRLSATDEAALARWPVEGDLEDICDLIDRGARARTPPGEY